MNKILVVDDDTDILGLVKIMLNSYNYDVKAISRWQEIDTTITDFHPDLVLLDVSLGGADGREICKSIKTAKETQNLPVILFSANPDMGKFIEDCRAQSFISKPFEMKNLLSTIQHFMN
ncbi:MAG: response regulator [Ginsengibacter sp.]|jgi:DNA-binding response OmpR family regulator